MPEERQIDDLQCAAGLCALGDLVGFLHDFSSGSLKNIQHHLQNHTGCCGGPCFNNFHITLGRYMLSIMRDRKLFNHLPQEIVGYFKGSVHI